MNKFKNIMFDIVGYCNAKCPYCLSGKYRKPGRGHISTELFDKTLGVLSNEVLERNDIIDLFVWGEPFLHPQLDELLTILNNYGYKSRFSTNASKVPHINKNFVKNLEAITFSLPGFSQESYDKIHGFRFDNIQANIKKIINECRDLGFNGEFRISYHVY